MPKEKPQSELSRLRKEQNTTRQDEIFGGLSKAEWTEYNGRTERILELESEIQAIATAEKSLHFAKLGVEQPVEVKIKNPTFP
jgi:hypothetical protein